MNFLLKKITCSIGKCNWKGKKTQNEREVIKQLSFAKDVGRRKFENCSPIRKEKEVGEKKKEKNGPPIEKQKHLTIHPFQRDRRLGSM